MPTLLPKEVQPHIKDYLLLLLRKKWIVIASIITVMTPTFISMKRVPVIYQATTKILICGERLGYPIMPYGGDIIRAQQFLIFRSMETQFEIIRSRPIAEEAVRVLKLVPLGSPERLYEAKVRSIQGSINLNLIKGTDMILLSVKNQDPKLAMDITNTVAKIYIEQALRSKSNLIQDTMANLNEQIANLRIKLEEAEDALQTFKDREGIISMAAKREIEISKTMKLEEAYGSAKTERLKMEAELRHLEGLSRAGESILSAFIISSDPAVKEIELRLSDLKTDLAELYEIYKDKYPEVVQLKIQIAETEEALNKEAELARERLVDEYNALKTREESLQATVEGLKESIREFNQKEFEYSTLVREVELNKKMFDGLSTKMKEISMVSEVSGIEIRIVEPAKLPRRPLPVPRRGKLSAGLLIGIILGIALALFSDYLDTTLKTPKDLERYLGVLILGVIPKMKPGLEAEKYKAKKKRGRSLQDISRRMDRRSENLKILRQGILSRVGGIFKRRETKVKESPLDVPEITTRPEKKETPKKKKRRNLFSPSDEENKDQA